MCRFIKSEYQIKTAYDGLSSLNKVGIEVDYIKCSSKHVDIVSIISELCSTSPFSLDNEYVYEHQETLQRSPDMLEKLNFKMSIKTNSIEQKQIIERKPYPIHSKNIGIGSIKCNGEFITSRIKYTLYTSISNTVFNTINFTT